MKDVNAHIFYKAKFRIQVRENGEVDLLWKVVDSIRRWITFKMNYKREQPIIARSKHQWSYFKKGGKLYDLGRLNRIYAESLYVEEADDPELACWACRIIEKPEPESGYATREWITEIGYRTIEKGTAEISYVVTYSDFAGFIGYCLPVPQANVPKVIRFLMEDPELRCFIGSQNLSRYPLRLQPGDFPEFWKTILDPEREVPVIYISPKRPETEDGEPHLLLQPQALADCVAANAQVYYSDSMDFSHEMGYLGKPEYICSGGMVRVYRPHVDPEADGDASRHRFLTAGFIESQGQDAVLNIFRKALAQDVYFYETFFRMNDCRMLIERKKNQAAIDQAESAYVEASDEANLLSMKIQELKDELKRVNMEKENYLLRINELCSRERGSGAGGVAEQIRSIRKYPETALDIVRYFETAFPDRIAFTDRGIRSLEECTTKSNYLWEALYHICTTLYDLLKQRHPTAPAEFKRLTGWECSRCEGSMTRENPRLMKQFRDQYRGREINIEAHVKNGTRESDPKFVRIYYAYDPAVADKILIGHCGKHLENYSTQKARR